MQTRKKTNRQRPHLHNTELYAYGQQCSRNKVGECDFHMLSKQVQVHADKWMILNPVCCANKGVNTNFPCLKDQDNCYN